MFNEGDSKLYINFEFCEGKNHRHFIDLQKQANYDDKENSKKILHILEDATSGVQVGDIEQVIISKSQWLMFWPTCFSPSFLDSFKYSLRDKQYRIITSQFQ